MIVAKSKKQVIFITNSHFFGSLNKAAIPKLINAV